MTSKTKICVLLTLICAFIGVGENAEADEVELREKNNGFGDDYNWLNLDDGYRQAKEQNKPLMLIIHKSWCGACKALKPKFAESSTIKELSQHFVMVNTMDDEEPAGDIYQPDGGYVPRILFFDSSGQLLRNIYNENGNPKYKYYYYDAEGVAAAMRKVVLNQPLGKSEL